MNARKLYVLVDTGAIQIFDVDQNREARSRSFIPSGVELYEALMSYLKNNHQFLIGRLQAAHAILAVGSAVPTEQHLSYSLKGRDMNTGLPAQREISTSQINEAIAPTLNQIVREISQGISSLLVMLPPDAKLDNEIVLSGDYSTLRGLAERLQAAIRAKAMPNATVIVKNITLW